MRSTTILAAALSIVGSAQAYGYADTCNDACYNAVNSCKDASRDCSNYLAHTVTPPASTVTVTSTVSKKTTTTVSSTTTIFSVVGAPYAKRGQPPVPTPIELSESEEDIFGDALIAAPDVTVTRSVAIQRRYTDAPLPTYAAAACDKNAYSSACGCIGVFPSTITATPSLTTTTITTTKTSLRTATRIIETSVPVCDPANNYGLIYNAGLSRTPKTMKGMKYTVRIFDPAGSQACCVRCYNTPGCFTYDEISSGRKCRLYVQTAGTWTEDSGTHLCPSGKFWAFPNKKGNDFGLGPCNRLYREPTEY